MGLTYWLLQMKCVILFARRGEVFLLNLLGMRGMFFIKTGGLLAG
jgi:hypothetical protein